MARTENPLQNAMEPVAKVQTTRARTEKQKPAAKGGKGGEAAAGGAPEKKAYVPPPPPEGPKIPPPAGMPPAKTFPVSSGPAPPGMSFPGVSTAEPEKKADGGEGGAEGQDGAAPAEEEIDDGFTPEQRRKNALEMDSGFKKYLMMYRMKIPLVNIRNKITNDAAGYTKADIDLFATNDEIEAANYSLDVM